ncbi:TetR/AcrR family transcriptional regulator [Nocardia yunnanensis]|uniref:TetR/AcrR family transcriptional regulator n=1 Tax=Nocardia yunnanensis TaxID=2382165 RepID=A0A386ZGR5_9NOCA|nr:TetR/AcrR family transcriptional regulator [Nocardia yunnanensis]AYF76781.1 TetR/AcrR family transcriptional regulator [Nocardia yunnanensis]
MEAPVTRTGTGPRRADAIYAATLELLAAHGYDGLTMEAVAQRSGVNKTTLYRWWPSKDALFAAALTTADILAITIPDTGTLRGDLLALATDIARLLTAEATAPIVTAVLAAAPTRPQLAATGRAFFAERLAREQSVFTRAVERGELSASASASAIMDMLAGALWFRLMLRAEPLTAAYVETSVGIILDGVGSQGH